ncbi:MAG: PHP domain-containing protein [Desulfovibrionaceae bacterium]|jgi:hypothetical protein|nr:PHP domain-containing protein [Desulfovibrionaceae bacterium]
MRIDLHAHTSAHSHCSVIKPDRLAELALARGLDGVVLTEHNVWWSDAEAHGLRARHPGLTIYVGAEITTREGYDVVVIGPSRPALPPLPPFDLLAERLTPARADTFLFLPHAFRFFPRPTAHGERLLAAMDGLEMNSLNILRTGWIRENDRYVPLDHEIYEDALARHGLIPVYNSDAHRPLAVGAVATVLELAEGAPPPGDEAALARALKAAPTREHQNPLLVGEFLAMF